LDEDDVEKEVAYLAKNFQKFMKMKNNVKSFGKGKSSSFKNDKKDFKKKDAKECGHNRWESPPSFCNGLGTIYIAFS